MELIIELTPGKHQVARLDAKGAKQYFPDRLWPTDGPFFPDVVLLRADLALAGRVAPLYAEKMEEGPLLHPLEQLAALPLEAGRPLTEETLVLLQGMALLVKKMIVEAEIQFGTRANQVDLHFPEGLLQPGLRELLKDWFALLPIPLRQIRVGQNSIWSEANRERQAPATPGSSAIGLGFNGQAEEIYWIAESVAVYGKRYAGRLPETTPQRLSSVEVYTSSTTSGAVSRLGALVLDPEALAGSKVEWEICRTAKEELYTQIIDWISGHIYTASFSLTSRYHQQLLFGLSNLLEHQSYVYGN